jgi:hypothetical protein
MRSSIENTTFPSHGAKRPIRKRKKAGLFPDEVNKKLPSATNNLPEAGVAKNMEGKEQRQKGNFLDRLARTCTVIVGAFRGECIRREIDKARQAISEGEQDKERKENLHIATYHLSRNPVYSCRDPSQQESSLFQTLDRGRPRLYTSSPNPQDYCDNATGSKSDR